LRQAPSLSASTTTGGATPFGQHLSCLIWESCEAVQQRKKKTKTKKSSNGWKLEATFPSVAASISSHLHISRRYLLFCFLFFFFPFIFFLVFYCVCACSAAAPIVLHV
jgi:hypothetical protein